MADERDPRSHAEEDALRPSGPGSLKDQGDLLDDDGEDRRQYTGEPVETDEGWVVPESQNVGDAEPFDR